MEIFEGKMEGRDKKIAVVVSRLHDLVTEELLRGTISQLGLLGVNTDDVFVYKVPDYSGLLRISKRIANEGEVDAIICLGAIIRESSSAFDSMSTVVTRHLFNLSIKHDIPVLDGIVMADSLEEAMQSAGIKKENYGRRVADYAIELVSLEQLL